MPPTFKTSNIKLRFLLVLILAGVMAGVLTLSHIWQYIQPSVQAAALCSGPNFETVIDITVSCARAISVADFNGDGKADLAVANNSTHGRVAILLGNASGGFSAATEYQVGRFPVSVVADDFNGDGKMDVATANNSSIEYEPTILFGDGTGQLGSKKSLFLSTSRKEVPAS